MLYENNALGKLPDKRYAVLESQYTAEQEALDSEIINLQNFISGEESSPLSAGKFIALVKRYQDFEDMTNVMLNSSFTRYCSMSVRSKTGRIHRRPLRFTLTSSGGSRYRGKDTFRHRKRSSLSNARNTSGNRGMMPIA